MRIIAGTARGRRLFTPDDRTIRPTSDRVRENLFNILAGGIEDGLFLDLFCGTGAIGIEALSRGAARATFVDASETALRLTRQNLLHCQLAQRATCLKLTLPEQLCRAPEPYDVIFVDPPNTFEAHENLLLAVQEKGWTAPEARVIIESDTKRILPEQAGRMTLSRTKRYGDRRLTFYT